MEGYNTCGDCIHWHEWPREKQKYSLKMGDCDKIPKGTTFEGGKCKFKGCSFEDECYDWDLHCFDARTH